MVDAKYIRSGKLSLYDIALDIKNRKLTGADIDRLAEEPLVQQAFFGDLEPIRQPKTKWNRKFLDKLCMAPALKCFNHEYLLYLDEVAEYVFKMRRWKHLAIGIFIVLAVVATVTAILSATGILG